MATNPTPERPPATTPISDEPVVEIHHTAAAEFLRRNSKLLVIAAVALVALAAIASLLRQRSLRRNESTLVEFADATSADQFAVIAAKSPRSFAGIAASYLAAATALKDGDLDRAEAGFQAFLSQHPGDPTAASAQLGLAQVAEERDNLDSAVVHYQNVLSSYPESIVTQDARLGLGRCYELLGRTEDARRAYEATIAANPESIWARLADERLAGLPAAPPLDAAPTEDTATSEAVVEPPAESPQPPVAADTQPAPAEAAPPAEAPAADAPAPAATLTTEEQAPTPAQP